MSSPLSPVFALARHLWLAGLLAVALSAAALTHHVPQTRDDPALAAFLQAGGTYDDLCGERSHVAGASGCDVCRLIGAALVPRHGAGPARSARATLRRALRPAPRLLTARLPRRTNVPRAPPAA